MKEPSLALQGAIWAALQASEGLRGIVGDQLYDRVDPDAARPFVRLGDDQVIPQPADCFEGSVEIYVTIHAFSSDVGKPEAKRIAGAIVEALSGAELDLGAEWSLHEMLHDGSRYIDEPDGLSTQGVITFRAYLNPT